MAVQGTGSNSRLLRDVVQTGIGTIARKGPFGHFEDTLAVAQGIRSRLSLGRLGAALLHFKKILQPEIVSDYLLIRRTSPFYLTRAALSMTIASRETNNDQRLIRAWANPLQVIETQVKLPKKEKWNEQ
jgi:hypothetical protein